MADYELTFNAVSIPTNSGGIDVTVEEDSNSDGTTDTIETISLSDGVTSYSTSSDAFAGAGQVALSFDIGPPSDVTVTASSLFPVNVQTIYNLAASTATTTSNGQDATIIQQKQILTAATASTTSTGVDATLFQGFGPSRTAASGWSVSITHPVSGRVIRPDVIDPRDVQLIPGPNTLPSIRIPIRRAPEWLDSQFDENPDMSVYLDGDQLPIDELVDVEDQEGRTVLVGEGGVELRKRVSAEYDAEERPVAADNLVTNNTSYATVDNTNAADQDTVNAQDPSGESELASNITLSDTEPFVFTGGGIKPAQTCFTVEGENWDSGSDSGGGGTSTDYSNGAAATFSGTSGDVSYNFTTNHRITESELNVWIRFVSVGTGPQVEISIDGNLFMTITSGEFSVLDWQSPETSGGIDKNWTAGDLSAGSHTLRINATGGGTGQHDIDVVAPLDAITRFTGGSDATAAYTFDNTVNTTDGYLDGPEYYPPSLDAVFDAYTSAFSVVGGSVSVTINDTSNDQALALSNDFGSTYDITGSNTTSISGTFPDAGGALTFKATLSHYEPSGTRNATPRTGYDAQRLDAYDMDATVEFESLLIDQEFDDSLASVLNQILPEQFAWKVSNESGTTTVTIDEPGDVVADRDPEVSEKEIRKRVITYSSVTIKGSSVPVSGETFQASTSFVDLVEDNIQTGSEAVYDASGTQFQRGVDYSMDYGAGEIKALSGGDLVTNDSYNIDYRHQIQGTHSVPGATGEQLVETIPGVVSDRQAEQIAFVLAEVYPAVSEPRYEGQIVVPRLDATFDPLKSLELAQFDLPSAATPLTIRGEPELSPLGLVLSLGSAPRLEASLSSIAEQVGALSDRA